MDEGKAYSLPYLQKILNPVYILCIGFVAQGLFGARMIIQWLISEKSGKVTSPAIFWKLSFGGAVLFTIYGFLQQDIVIVFGQVLNSLIYIRNLQIKKRWQSIGSPWRIVAISAVPLSAWGLLAYGNRFFLSLTQWGYLGIAGQVLLNIRFVYQWVYSEKFHQSIFTPGFWNISIAGSMLVIAYAAQKPEYVLLVAQGAGLILYIRNAMIAHNENHN